MPAKFDANEFLAFVKSKPADEAYDWFSITGCAMHQFLVARGFPVSTTGRWDWADTGGDFHPIPDIAHESASVTPYTFGSLASRLEAALAKGA